MSACDLGQGSIAISGQTATCGGSSSIPIGQSFTITGSGGSGNQIEISNAALSLTLSAATASAPLQISGSTVAIHFEGVNQFSGIQCSESNATFQAIGEGSLRSNGGSSPGIGPPSPGVCFSLLFVNGTIEAEGSTGIGAGNSPPSGETVLKNLTVLGGSITAHGTGHGAGIGSGDCDTGGSTAVDSLALLGGAITATTASEMDGAAIGSGRSHGSGRSAVGCITIANSTVSAQSGDFGSGIGTGELTSGGPMGVGNATIFNSRITAHSPNGGSAIGIGRGTSSFQIDCITILNTTITATSCSGGSGIGAGRARENTDFLVKNIIIIDGTIDTRPSSDAGGIGSGMSDAGINRVTNVTILNSNVTATASLDGSGIGTGRGGTENRSSVDKIVIVDSTVNATVIGDGAGIGPAKEGALVRIVNLVNANITATSTNSAGVGAGGESSRIEKLAIVNGRLDANGKQSAIGSTGSTGIVDDLRLIGSAVLRCNSMDENPVKASNLQFSGASLVFLTDKNRLFEKSPSTLGWANISILYGTVTTSVIEPLSELNDTFLQIGNVAFPAEGVWKICLSSQTFNRCLEYASSAMKSLLFSVPKKDFYEIIITQKSDSYALYPSEGVWLFNVDSNITFFPNAYWVLVQTESAAFKPSVGVPASSHLKGSAARTQSECATSAEFNLRTGAILPSSDFDGSTVLPGSEGTANSAEFNLRTRVFRPSSHFDGSAIFPGSEGTANSALGTRPPLTAHSRNKRDCQERKRRRRAL
jgi:hypothetical protein